jgi:hypothetical protein
VFCRKSEMSEVPRRRPSRVSKEETFRGLKMENVSRRGHTSPCSRGSRMSAPHWGSARRCPNVID